MENKKQFIRYSETNVIKITNECTVFKVDEERFPAHTQTSFTKLPAVCSGTVMRVSVGEHGNQPRDCPEPCKILRPGTT